MTHRTAVLAGGTGLVGGHLLRGLLADDSGYDRVRALVRREGALPAHPRLEEAVVDFDALRADLPVLQGVHDAYCALGTTMRRAGSREAFRRVDFDYVAGYARSVAGAGAEQLLFVSALGANPRSRVFYNRVKGEAEEAVKATTLLSAHAFRPSLLVGERAESRPGEDRGIAIARTLDPVLRGPLARYRAVGADAVARAMIAVARRRERGFHVHGNAEIHALAAGVT